MVSLYEVSEIYNARQAPGELVSNNWTEENKSSDNDTCDRDKDTA